MNAKPPRRGRPPLPEEQRARQRAVYLTATEWDQLRRICPLSPSEAIRELLRHADLEALAHPQDPC